MTSTRSDLERAAEQKVMQGSGAAPGATGTSGLAGSGMAGAPVSASTTTTTAGSALPTAAPAAGATATCGRQYFTTTEDRPVVREEVQIIREHHPVQKEFIVEAKPTGREREVAGGVASEVVGTTVREIPAQTVTTQAVQPTVVAQPVATTTQTTTSATGTAGAPRLP
ncbi:hypothetical protein WJX74_007534 [Apatococcus lobatus]|uniref:Uncharacterized protein n=1 Tax=Apatococcus lobatus TaxID=904363 RepID=A0AAW1RTK7_9CHLO